jgi:hypothetical protein
MAAPRTCGGFHSWSTARSSAGCEDRSNSWRHAETLERRQGGERQRSPDWLAAIELHRNDQELIVVGAAEGKAMRRAISIVVAFYIGFVLMLLVLDGAHQAERDMKTLLKILIESV